LEKWQLPISLVSKPSDLKKPIIEQEILLNDNAAHYVYSFSVTYVGDKFIRLYANAKNNLWNESYGGNGYTPKMRFRLKIKCNGEDVWGGENLERFNPRTFSFRDKVLGYTIANLNCPRDIPLDSKLYLFIDVLNSDSYFLENGPFKIAVINYIRE
jgi:hypothetical protein